MTSKKTIYDVIVIGGGPAGLAASLYTSRRTLKTLLITKDVGGQTILTTKIENYPGIDLIDGITLTQNFVKQAEKHGLENIGYEVTKVEKLNEHFEVSANGTKYKSRALIIAFGLEHRHLGVPGEIKLTGRGVSYCATCDAPLFRGKDVAIVGGGNSALDAAILLSKIANDVTVIHRADGFRADEITQDKIRNSKNITTMMESQVTEVKGDTTVKSIIVTNNKTRKETELYLDGVFIEIGYVAKTEWLKGLVDLNKHGEVIVDKNSQTSTAGIFAAGDITDINHKQIVIAAGQGATAALEAYKYLAKMKGTETPDWN
ncbi:thioredoxin-disulfide reductase [Patescibacteria group bacterium]|nr:thioredoxin-disulfide reductase [Patescibacteria group bacterium]